MNEFWNYFSSQLKNLTTSIPSGYGLTKIKSSVDDMLLFGAEHHRYDITKLWSSSKYGEQVS